MIAKTNLMCFRLSVIINLDTWYLIRAFECLLLHYLSIMKSHPYMQEIIGLNLSVHIRLTLSLVQLVLLWKVNIREQAGRIEILISYETSEASIYIENKTFLIFSQGRGSQWLMKDAAVISWDSSDTKVPWNAKIH